MPRAKNQGCQPKDSQLRAKQLTRKPFSMGRRYGQSQSDHFQKIESLQLPYFCIHSSCTAFGAASLALATAAHSRGTSGCRALLTGFSSPS